ncbi:MAG: hypothetical protein J6Q67_06705, partial [Clostridia bacterium]|nr:hypothetical protein [Clostridia bacterium]
VEFPEDSTSGSIGAEIVVDQELSAVSDNPIPNKAVTIPLRAAQNDIKKMSSKIYTKAVFGYREDTLENWEANNPVLERGEPSIVRDGADGEWLKIGDGVTSWKDLPWKRGPRGEKGETIQLPISKGTGEGSILINEGIASGDYSIAGGTTDKEFVEGVVGETLSSIVNLNKSDAQGALSIALGADNIAQSGGSVALGYNNISGAKGYYFDEIDFQNKTITLSTTRRASTLIKPSYPSTVDWKAGDRLLIINGDRYFLTVTDVSGNILTFEELPFTEVNYSSTLSIFTYSKPNDRTIVNIDQPKTGEVVLGWGAIGIGTYNNTMGNNSYAVGYKNSVAGDFGAAFGQENIVGYSAFATGVKNNALGKASHAEGNMTTAEGVAAHSEGIETVAEGSGSHAEGRSTKANGENSHAEGFSSSASGKGSHAEGLHTLARGEASHAEGKPYWDGSKNVGGIAEGRYSHSEGHGTLALGEASHAEGHKTKAEGSNSHAGGNNSKVGSDAENGFAHGYDVLATRYKNEAAFGKCNLEEDDAIFMIGNGYWGKYEDGTAGNIRKNAFVVKSSNPNGDTDWSNKTKAWAEVDSQGDTPKSVVIKETLQSYATLEKVEALEKRIAELEKLINIES